MTKTFLSCCLLCYCLLVYQPQAFAETKFVQESSTHFIVYYQQGVDKDFVAEIIKTAEGYYDEIASNLGFRRFDFWLWDDRAKLYIFSDKTEFQNATGQPAWSGGCALYSAKTIWTYPHAVGFFDSLLPHELGHIVFREFVGFGNNIPLWFEEGVASYQEKSKRFAVSSAIKELLLRNGLLTSQQIASVASPREFDSAVPVDIFYTQSISMADFLINHFGKDKFIALCQTLKKGVTFDQALASNYFDLKNFQDFYTTWRASLEQKSE